MNDILRSILNKIDPATRGWIAILAGELSRMSLGLISSVLIARALGPYNFGVLAVLNAAAGILSVLADFGLSAAGVKRISPAYLGDPGVARERGRAFFWTRVSFLFFSVGLCIALLGVLSRALGLPERVGTHTSQFLLLLTLLGVIATGLNGAVNTVLQAIGRFSRISLTTIANALLTALLAVILELNRQLNILTVLAVLGIGTSLVSFWVARLLLPARWDLRFPGSVPILKELTPLMRFGRWLGLANLFAALTTQVDVLILNHLIPTEIVGFYGLALNLANKVDVVNRSLYTVLLPIASRLQGRREYVSYLRRSLIRGARIGLLLFPLVLLARPLVVLIYGSAYARSGGLFRALLGLVVFDVLLTPFILLAFPLGRPGLLAALEALRAVTLLVAALWLVPDLGPAGAIIARYSSRLAGLVLIGVFLLGRFRSRPDESVRVENES